MENFLYSIIHFFSAIGLKGFVGLFSMIGGAFLFIFVVQHCTKENKENLMVGERLTKKAGITASGILFGILVCFPVSIYVFEKINESKVVVEDENAELIKVCIKTVKKVNSDSMYPADFNCSKISKEYGSTDMRLFKQRVEIALIAQQALRKERK